LDLKEELLEENDSEMSKYLTFLVDEKEYGIKTSYVNELVGVQEITVLPDLPQYLKGIINLRGTIIPVMDIRLKFEYEEAPYQEKTCIVVVNFDDMLMGIVVDEVQEVIEISESQIIELPASKNNQKNRYVQGIVELSNKVVLILNCSDLLLSKESNSEFEQAVENI